MRVWVDAMIHVCDAIMGSGKSQSAITYMNEHPDEKFVYITPYIEEAERIQESCPRANFITPSAKLREYGYSKVEHTKWLLAEGKNVATTHAAFRLYTEDMIKNIVRWDYTLIIDEAVNVLCELEESAGDVDVLERAGFITNRGDGVYTYNGGEYAGGRLDELFQMLKRNNILRLSADGSTWGSNDTLFFWELHPDVLRAFRNAYILTYLFYGQDIKYYLEMNGIDYDFVGIRKDGDVYRFSDTMEYYPSYIQRLDQMIHIFENQKLNEIGVGRFKLSSSWFENANEDDLKKLKNNLYNYFHNYNGDVPSDELMWTTFKNYAGKLRGRGFANQVTACNLRAFNTLRDKRVLAYCANIFVNPFKRRYLCRSGGEYDDDSYALSTMVQWIWRSAIRDGKEISIYIPSERMRLLLKKWIADTMESYPGSDRS